MKFVPLSWQGENAEQQLFIESLNSELLADLIEVEKIQLVSLPEQAVDYILQSHIKQSEHDLLITFKMLAVDNSSYTFSLNFDVT